jgi:DNA segregation ATPase FtsK/SpoIIIE, S-DNA-T family
LFRTTQPYTCSLSLSVASDAMSKQKNTLKQTETKPEPPPVQEKKSKEKVKEKKSVIPAWTKDSRVKRIFAIVSTMISVYLFLACISFIFTGHHDLRLIINDPSAISAEKEHYQNLLGKIGAHAAYFLMNRSFGLGGLFIPFIMFLFSWKLLIGKHLLPPAKTLRLSLFVMLFIPLFIGFFFHETQEDLGKILITCNDNLVGVYGVFVTRWCIFTLGWFGSLLLILIIAGSSFIFNFNPKFENWRLPSWMLGIGSLFKKQESPHPADVEGDFEMEEPVINEPETAVEDDIEDEETPFEIDRADAALDELISSTKAVVPPAPPVIEFKEEAEAEEVDDFEFEVAVEEKTVAAPVVEDEEELIIEATAKEELLTEDEIDSKVQEFGEYDPKLDLSRYELPNIDLLEQHGNGTVEINKDELEANKNRIVDTLNNYNIEISKIKATVGPTVTLYEIIPAPGVRISKIKNLEDDIALSLAALGIRIIAPIPGKGTIGIEVPNSKSEIVSMRSLIASDKFQNSDAELPIVMGKTITNETFVFDLAKMPHLLMAGATGQGKSVGLNAILVSLLYRKHPSQLKFVLVDPKKVELTLFNKIERHFLAKLPDTDDAIITDTSKVVTTLNSLCVEMDQRYELLKEAQCRNIKEYNHKFINRRLNPENGHRYMPYIVLVVDEFADLIMTAGKEVETPIARLAQLARAIGIHLIIATQRPSVNIITGTIKANFPARIAFRVTSKIDSRTILDAGGADQLIGRGDMLFSTGNDLTRIQCGFVDTPEVEKVTEFIGSQQGYPSAFLLPEFIDENAGEIGNLADEDRDDLFADAARIIVMHQQGSASLLQRKLKLGYNRAGRLIDQLEAAGIIGPFEGSKARKVLISDEYSLEQFLNGGA